MSKRLEKGSCVQPTEIIQPWIMHEAAFEDLIRDGRIPSFWDAEETTVVVLPPKGVKPGDEYESLCGGVTEYFAPNGGPSKGLASLHEIPTKDAVRLKEIKNKVLEEMGLITS